MRRKRWIVVTVVLSVVVGVFIRDSRTPQAPRVPVTERECVAVHIDVATGITRETPVPCRTEKSSGCTGTITAKVEDDGTLIATCR